MAVSDMSNPAADRKFVKSVMDLPLLEADHERDLARLWREEDDEAALHELTSAYVRLVVAMAGKFRNYGLPMSDLIQEGNIGLMQAAARFEPSRDVRFSTYASWWIRSCMQDFILRNWSIVRTGTTSSQKSLFFNLRRLRARINDTGDATMSSENTAYVARQLGVSERDVSNMASRLYGADRSLNAPLGENAEGSEWQDLLPDEGADPEHLFMDEKDGDTRRKWLITAMKSLNQRELTIILERKLNEESVTLEALGKRLGISKERVRQIEHTALKKLKVTLEQMVGDPKASGLLPYS